MARPVIYRLPQPYEELDHTADVGIRVHGDSREACLSRLVLGFTQLILAGGAIAPDQTRSLEVEAADNVTMAIDVLRECLFIFDTELCVPATCCVHRFDEESGVLVELGMGALDEDVHLDVTDLKAVTWHDARFEQTPRGWSAQIIFDV